MSRLPLQHWEICENFVDRPKKSRFAGCSGRFFPAGIVYLRGYFHANEDLRAGGYGGRLLGTGPGGLGPMASMPGMPVGPGGGDYGSGNYGGGDYGGGGGGYAVNGGCDGWTNHY